MPPGRWRYSRSSRSNSDCATSTRWRSSRKAGSCTMNRAARSCSAWSRKTSSDGGKPSMPAMSLNHYTILARDLEATKDFYTDIVGLKVGDRPPLNFPGYWLYCGDVPTVHLIGHRPEIEQIPDSSSDPAKTGRLDHIAFACAGLKDMKATLEQNSI